MSFQHPQGKGPLHAYLDVVIGAGHFWMVLNVKNILKLQADHKTLLQFDHIEAFRALRVRVGEIWAGDHTGPLSKEIVMAFHCGKHTKAK